MNIDATASVSIFRPATDDLLRLMERRILAGALTFFSPIHHVSRRAAQVAYVFHTFLNRPRAGAERTDYRTFFANSGVEALHGAIKIIRHKRTLERGPRSILIHDPSRLLREHFNPLSATAGRELVPGLQFEEHLARLLARLRNDRPAGLVLQVCEQISVDEARLLGMRHGAAFVLNASTCVDLSLVERVPCDIAVFGEAVTSYTMPFGAFSVSCEAYSPWNTASSCLKHSSTYGANGLALDLAFQFMTSAARLTREELSRSDRILANCRAARRAFRRYINPKAPDQYKFERHSPRARRRARSTRLHKRCRMQLSRAQSTGCHRSCAQDSRSRARLLCRVARAAFGADGPRARTTGRKRSACCGACNDCRPFGAPESHADDHVRVQLCLLHDGCFERNDLDRCNRSLSPTLP
jgi:hypothetical protein